MCPAAVKFSKEHKLNTMKFVLHDFHARPDGGRISGDIDVSDFSAPHVTMNVSANFDLGFVSKFLNLEHVHNVSGAAKVKIKFDDIIDLKNPHHAVSKLDEEYEMTVALDNVHFSSDRYPLPFKILNFYAEVRGHQAKFKLRNLLIGTSDISVAGTIDDLPAIIHHTDVPVDARLKITSKYLDLFELTGSNKSSIDEQIEDLSLDFDFKTSAQNITESKYLPQGDTPYS